MKHFRKVVDVPFFDVLPDWQILLLDRKMEHLPQHGNEICLNTTTPGTDCYEGAGSIKWDWARKEEFMDDRGVKQVAVPLLKNQKKEEDFIHLCDQFVDTEFERLWHYFNTFHRIGRIKLFRSEPKTCLSWHQDATSRLHLPVVTEEGARMVIQDEVLHMQERQWYWADTTKKHSAFNGSMQRRYHVVVGIMDDEEFEYGEIDC